MFIITFNFSIPSFDATMTKSSSDPATNNQTQNQKGESFYQALGCVYGKLTHHATKGYGLDIDGKIFPASFIYSKFGKAPDLLDGKLRFFKVWPQRPTKTDSPLGFRILSWHTEAIKDWPLGVFRLSGVWQFIPQSSEPVISIYRNQIGKGEKRPKLCQHLLLQWPDAPQPWRWEPDSDSKPLCYSLATRLDPESETFIVLAPLADPCKPPRRVKPTQKKKPKRSPQDHSAHTSINLNNTADEQSC